MTCCEADMIILVQLLGARTPKILEDKKTSTIRRDFWQLQILIANISGMENTIDKHYQPQSLLCLTNKLSELRSTTTEFTRLMFTHPKSTVRAISDNSTLRSRISVESTTQSTSGKRRYQVRSLSRPTKKTGELWSTNKIVHAANVYLPKMNTACVIV